MFLVDAVCRICVCRMILDSGEWEGNLMSLFDVPSSKGSELSVRNDPGAAGSSVGRARSS